MSVVDTSILLHYLHQNYDRLVYLNGNNIDYPQHAFPEIIGFGLGDELMVNANEKVDWQKVESFIKKHQGAYLFTNFNYQLKNEFEFFKGENHDPLNFPLLHLYKPEHVLIKQNNQWTSNNADTLSVIHCINEKDFNVQTIYNKGFQTYTAAFDHEKYIQTVQKIKRELIQGNVYEINFCNSYTGAFKEANAVDIYLKLNHISPMPFSACYACGPYTIVAASPERFIKKNKNTLISQPIKGTAARNQDATLDHKIKFDLETSLKERTENVMIVDLVRNDLSKICKAGTVKVQELCKAYTFTKVHQLISTISGELENNTTSLKELLNALFPMGSMTGAPKYKAMQLIDELEVHSRGMFSGSIGYIAPNGDFDFNVVIRSILLNHDLKIYQFHAGSAITYAAVPEHEYQECSIKIQPIVQLLKSFEDSSDIDT
jgi:para-aminobenzoate synthetase component 1